MGQKTALDNDIIAIFEQQVTDCHEQTAVIGKGQSLTYLQLDNRVNQIAWQLHEQNIGLGDCVAIYIDRSVDMVAGVLATLKVGACYLPIDASYPSERIGYMISNAQPAILLTLSDIPRPQVIVDGLQVPCLDLDLLAAEKTVTPMPLLCVPSNACAYLMYTSGSTGLPKGVMINRQALLNHALHMADTFELTPDDRALQFSSFSFDIAVEEVYSTLLSGATLVLYDDDLGLGLEAFEEYVITQAISVVNLPTAYWHLWAAYAKKPLMDVRLVIVGGEAARFDCLEDWQAIHSHTRWLNTYGPTETTVTASIWDDKKTPLNQLATEQIPLGNPLNNGVLYILDEGLNQVPQGVTGRLFIGGIALANGYWKQSDTTAEAFLPDPFGSTPGMRMYDSGDLVRRNLLGDLEYKGRADHQVKIRGFRIEPDEVAVKLKDCEGVDGAVVIAISLGDSGKQLIGYAATKVETVTEVSLKAALAAQLPDFMVPSQIVILGSLPLTANGKVDRKALPEPSTDSVEQVAPDGETETVMAQHWCELLGRDSICVNDNFFSLGGHSLLAVQLTSHIRESFGIDFQVKTLFESPTIRSLCQHIEGDKDTSTQSYPLMPMPAHVDKVLSYSQQRLWFLDQLEGGSTVYNMPTAMRLSGQLDIAALQNALNRLVERHESLRTTFIERAGEPFLQVGLTEDWSMTQENIDPAEVAARVDAFSSEVFDLANGPLFKALLLIESDNSYVLATNQHHIISDGWSSIVFGAQLSAFYHAQVTGSEPKLAPMPIQYSDYAWRQREWLEGGELERQLGYWQTKMADAVSLLELPTDRLRPAVQTFNGSLHGFDIDAEVASKVKKLAAKHGCTAYMVWLTGYKVLLAIYSGQRDIVVGTPTANRGRIEVENIIGFFVNTLVLRDVLDWHGTFEMLLMQVRTTLLDAQSHQDVPFEQQVAQQPTATALVDKQRRLSYEALNHQVDKLCWALDNQGVKADDRVAIYIDRCAEMVIAALAVLKLGACYLPIDASYPSERASFMLEDAEPALMLCRSGLVFDCDVPVLLIDDVESVAKPWPLKAVKPLTCAYLMYTSGSTGRPKGVQINRQGLLNHGLAMARKFELTTADVAMQFSSFSFDIAVEELYSTLMSGATLVLYDDSRSLGLSQFEAFLKEQKISIVNLPTAYWHLWAEYAQSNPAVLPDVRLVVVGGEAARFDSLQNWLGVYPDIRWLNTYGPTETTVTASHWFADALPDQQIPLGNAIDNSQLYILDDRLNPVPAGVAGQLYIGGKGLATGYWQRPDQTAEAFVPDPFCDESGVRMYNTGDVVRLNRAGQLEYIGRSDFQVKIRGFRIEPDEIAAALRRCKGVSDSLVLVFENQSSTKRLIGYVVAQASCSSAGVKAELMAILPDYMIPAQIVVMDAFKLTANGKIDPKALPEPSFDAVEYVAPVSETEVQMQQIWQTVLQQEQISITANFFDVGGHSLLAVRLVSQIKSTLEIELRLLDLYKWPTIRELARLKNRIVSTRPLVPIHLGQGDKIIFAIHPVGGDVFAYKGFEQLDLEASLYGLQRPELGTGGAIVYRSIEQMADIYLVEILEQQPSGPYHLMAWSMGGTIALEIAQRLEQLGHKIGSILLIDHVPMAPTGDSRAHYKQWLTEHQLENVEDPGVLLQNILSQPALRAQVEQFFDLQPEAVEEQGADRITALTLANYLASQEFEQNVRVSPQRMTLVMATQTQAVIDEDDHQDWFAAQVDAKLDKLVLEADHYSIMSDENVALIRVFLAG